jgi:glutathione synthase/RimK-type ligase-like ATP-grasp enzyme
MAADWLFDLYDSRSRAVSQAPPGQPAVPGADDAAPRPAGAPRVLVVTQRFDPHADVVTAALHRAQVPTLRLNTEDFHSCSVDWDCDQPGLRIGKPDGQFIDLHQATACYFRRPAPLRAHPGLGDEAARQFCAAESEAFLSGVYALPGLRWISHPVRIQAAEAKVGQLALARRIGLPVPRTLVTNDPARAIEFTESLPGDLVVKPLRTSFLTHDRNEIEIYAQRLTKPEFSKLADLVRFTPTLLQEAVAKTSEVRVTVMGSQLFAVEISPRGTGIPFDWTSVSSAEFTYRPIQLPIEIERLVQVFLKWYGLEFGAVDFARADDGSLFFLENNPNGVWYWLEMETGLPMADRMARLLTVPGPA